MAFAAAGTGDTHDMLRQGPLSLTMHAAAEPLLVAILIAAPFLLGFSDVGSATAVSIIAGVAILVVAMSTCWRLSVVKVIPVMVHALLDLGLGALLIASPFLFGFSDEAAPTAFFIVFGLLEILATLATRWRPAEDDAATRPRGRRATLAH